MNTTKEQIKVMQAYVDGKEIEFLDSGGKWCKTSNPAWDWCASDYRIVKEEAICEA